MGDRGACVGCYARQHSETRFHRVVFGGPGRGEGTRDVRADSAWKQPLQWEREAAKRHADFEANYDGLTVVNPPLPTFVFPSMCDPFDNHPDLVEPRRRFFDLIRDTPNLTWLLLTKRPGNIVSLFDRAHHTPEGEAEWAWPRNAAIGLTAVTQEEFDRDWPKARDAFHALRAPFVFWSGEPLLGGIVLPPDFLALGPRAWAITGGETDQGAHKARPSATDWFRSVRDQCAAAGVAYHHKQNGEWAPLDDEPEPNPVFRVGKERAGRLLDGVLHDAMPSVSA